jgi:dihydropyrimidine dehydrogenase (NAD+) subunit PreA
MASLNIRLKGRILNHPAFIASGPPGNNERALKTALRPKGCTRGWNLETKTYCLDPQALHVVNTIQRLGSYYDIGGGSPLVTRRQDGARLLVKQNTELISTERALRWYDYNKGIKDFDPSAYLLANVLAGTSPDEWAEVVGRSFESGADGVVGNVSCPHGLPNVGAGSSIGENPLALEPVCAAIKAATPEDKLCLVKATPNVTPEGVKALARAAFRGGIDGITATNTYSGLIVDPLTLLPVPLVQGVNGQSAGTWGGISAPGIRAQAQGVVARIGTVIRDEWAGQGKILGGLGGIWYGQDAAIFLALGADFFMVCTRIMEDGYGILDEILDGLESTMDSLGLTHIQPAEGVDPDKVLQGYTLRHVKPQQADMVEAERSRIASAGQGRGPTLDEDWTDVVADSTSISG